MEIVPSCRIAISLYIFAAGNFFFSAESANILFLSFAASRSHQNVYEPLMLELAHRGHNVTLVSPVETGKKLTNFHEITIPSFPSHSESHVKSVFARQQSPWKSYFVIPTPFLNVDRYKAICTAAYNDSRVLALTRQKFDLVFLKNFLNECSYGLAHVLNTSTILTTTFPAFRWNVDALGGFYPPSFIPGFVVTYSHRMNFFERVINFIGEVLVFGMRHFIYLPQMEGVYRQAFNQSIPSAYEIERNSSLLLINGDWALTYTRPHLPNMIEVGGLHCTNAQPLNKDLEEFITGSGDHGFIYFSLGSIMQSHMMPPMHVQAFLNAFAKLRQRVIWKWEGNTSSLIVPENVKLAKWLPQQDILGHPKILAFITHGGLLSMEEAVFHGVPIVGIPMFGDQHWNVRQAEDRGFGIQLDFHATVDSQRIGWILRRILHRSFRDKAKEMSRMFRDKMDKPLERAVFWTEYVLRHKGAGHLRSAGQNLNFWQYHSLDVIAALSLLTLSIVCCTVFVVVNIGRFIRRSLQRCITCKSFIAKKKKSS